jgi:FMN phosphatase YigB (HAD superfamily)
MTVGSPAPSKITALVCDVGGVLLDMSGPERRSPWAQRLGITVDALCEQVWDAIGFRNGSQRPEVIDRIAQRTGLTGIDATALLDDFASHWIRNEELVGVLQSLRGRYRMAVLGNIPSSGRFAFEDVLHLNDIFDLMVLSGEEGIAKPDPAIYHLVCDRLDTPPEECAFVDDMQENVDAATQVGMTAHRHVSTADTIEWLGRHLR